MNNRMKNNSRDEKYQMKCKEQKRKRPNSNANHKEAKQKADPNNLPEGSWIISLLFTAKDESVYSAANHRDKLCNFFQREKPVCFILVSSVLNRREEIAYNEIVIFIKNKS